MAAPRRVSLILVTDPRWSDERIAQVVRAASSLPGFCVQLRDRSARPDDALFPLASELRKITASTGSLFVVNRRIALARRVAADGIHAPATELDAATEFSWRSAPAHSDEELQNARTAGASAALVSPIFASPGKAPSRGLDALRSARALAPDMTLVALGGIDASNAAACFDAGADAIAVIRALLDAPDPALAAKWLGRA